MSFSNEARVTRALRAAIVVTGLVSTAAVSTTLSGCDTLRERITEGTGTNGEVCIGWSMQGSPRRCCESRGGYYSGGFFTGSCVPLSVPGPFIPPAFDA